MDAKQDRKVARYWICFVEPQNGERAVKDGPFEDWDDAHRDALLRQSVGPLNRVYYVGDQNGNALEPTDLEAMEMLDYLENSDTLDSSSVEMLRRVITRLHNATIIDAN